MISLLKTNILKLKQFIALILFVSFSLIAGAQQKWTVESAIREVESGAKDFDQELLTFFSQTDHHHFLNKQTFFDFLKQSELLAQNNQTELYPEICYQIGRFFLNHEKYREAYYYFYRTLKTEKNLTDPTKEYIPNFHEDIAVVYFNFSRYANAENHLKKSLNHPLLTKHDRINVLNTLALVYRDLKDYEQSRIYTERALSIAKSLKHKPWIAVLTGNLGYLLFKLENYEAAKKMVRTDYLMSKSTSQAGSELSALTLLIEIDLIQKNTTSAKKYMSELKQLVNKYPTTANLRSYYRVLTMVHETMGNFSEALKNYKLYIAYKDSILNSKNAVLLQNTEFQIDFEQHQSEISLLNEKKKKDDLKITGLIIIISSICVAGFIIIIQIQKRRKKSNEILELQKLRVEEELKNTEREMKSILSNLIDKNQLIEELRNEISVHHSEESAINKQEKEKLLDKLQSFTLLTDDDWLDFKKLFNKLNPGFIDYFNENHKDVTPSEVRLATLLKLNLSNIEMAKTLGISPDSVRKTNLRLRKKLNIEYQDDLLTYIRQI